MHSVGTLPYWIGFGVCVIVMLGVDLGLINRKAHVIKVKEAAVWTAIWISLALLFNLFIYFKMGSARALEFTTGYLIEKALSVDNIFVFAVVFGSFGTPPKYQHRVLFWGILGALVTRGLFIAGGAALLQRFHWVMYVFGALLVLTAVRLLVRRDHAIEPSKNPMVRLVRRLVPVTTSVESGHFITRQGGTLYATPLLLVLVAVEASDIVFAIDSIPAIFSVTTDPFIVYTSNVFAILGLRSLYFLLAGAMRKFELLDFGLALVLAFIGIKMLIGPFYQIPILISLGTIVTLLLGTLLASAAGKRHRTS